MNSFDEIFTEVKKYNTIILHRHRHPDPDAIGSQAGLAFSLRLAFPDKKVLCAGGPVGDLDWINTMDNVEDADYKNALVITTDSADQPRISDQRFKNGEKIVKIDHHPNIDPYGDLQFVDPYAPAASEIVFDFLKAEKLPLNKDIATALYAGIIGDTGRVMYQETSTHTFDVARPVSAQGIDISEIARRLSEVTLEEAKLQNLVLNWMHIDPCGAAYAVLTTADLEKAGVAASQASVTVSTPGRIKGVMAWNVFIEQADGTFRVHYRSKGPEIDKLAQRHHGGGHALASGAQAKDRQEIKQIFAELVDATKNYKENHDH